MAQTVIGERQRRDGEDDEGTDPAVGTTYRMLDQHYYPKKRSAVDEQDGNFHDEQSGDVWA